jgi:hypothetical protein
MGYNQMTYYLWAHKVVGTRLQLGSNAEEGYHVSHLEGALTFTKGLLVL